MVRLNSATVIIAIVTLAVSALAIVSGLDGFVLAAGFIPARLSGLIDMPGGLPAWLTPWSAALLPAGPAEASVSPAAPL